MRKSAIALPKRPPGPPAGSRGQVFKPFTSQAPVGGLNVRDAIGSMPNGDAYELVNWIPQQYGVRCRKGYRNWATGMVNPVRTVVAYQPDQADLVNYRLFAITDAAIFDVTSSSATPPTSLALPGTDGYGRFSTTMFSNDAGNYLLTCSHEGGYRYYDGTSWVTPTMGGGAGQVSGVDPSNLCFVTLWKRKAWFVEKGTTNVWYAATDSITGTFTKLNVGPLLKHGGRVSFIATWTIDAGEGTDDFLVIGAENGDILIYKGTDPSSATTFGLVGVWYVGALVRGRRSFVQLGGDLLVLSELGLQPMSYVTRGGQSLFRTSAVDYMSKIQPLLTSLVSQTADEFGWEMTLFPRENLLIIQRPKSGFAATEQYAMFTNTYAWTRLRDLPIETACVAVNEYWFGTEDGRVCLGFNGFFDAVPLGSDTGNGIIGVIQPAFNYFGMPVEKQFHLVRPTFLASDRPGVNVQMLVDFQTNLPSGSPISGGGVGSVWDTALWDSGVWGGELNRFADWYGAAAIGTTGSVYMDTTTVGDTLLASIDYTFESCNIGIG